MHYYGHECHHIRPDGGCPTCHHHFCYVCLGSSYDAGTCHSKGCTSDGCRSQSLPRCTRQTCNFSGSTFCGSPPDCGGISHKSLPCRAGFVGHLTILHHESLDLPGLHPQDVPHAPTASLVGHVSTAAAGVRCVSLADPFSDWNGTPTLPGVQFVKVALSFYLLSFHLLNQRARTRTHT
jgi:hypothetical protein